MQVSSGARHSCALSLDQVIKCWGQVDDRDREPPGLYIQVSCGYTHSCAITIERRIYCWGPRGLGTNEYLPPGKYVQVSAGRDHDCALKSDGQIVCWGSETMGRLEVPAGVLFKQVSASSSWNSCGLTLDGDVRCWGSITASRGEVDDREGDFQQVSSGRLHNCAIRTGNHSLDCWGYLSGHIHMENQAHTVRTARWDQLSLGSSFACGVTMESEVLCWGSTSSMGETDVPESLIAA
eukprot:scaffold1227_cov256-Pinguiococcus_pyrenoidosus.AAC.2